MPRPFVFVVVAMLIGVAPQVAHAQSAAPASSPDHCVAVRGYEHPSFEFRYGIKPETALLLAPRQARFAETARQTATNTAEAQYWSRQAKAQRTGVALLQNAGLTDGELDALADHEFVDSTGSSGIDGSVVDVVGKDVDTRLGKAPAQFSKELKRRLGGNLSAGERTALGFVAEACGVVPDSAAACARLLTSTDAARVVGEVAKTSTQGECLWQGAKSATGAPQLVVRVYETAGTFDWYATVSRLGTRTPVAGTGDQAVWTELSPIGTACSQTRTLVVRAGDRTVVVGVCDGSGAANEDAVLAAARTVVDHLA
jgi:hypothetical protein